MAEHPSVTPFQDTRQTKVDAGYVIGEAAKTYGRHAFVVVGASVMVQTIALAATLSVANGSGIGSRLLSFLIPTSASLLLTGMLTMVLMHVRESGTVPGISELVTKALPRVPMLLVLSWLTGVFAGVASLGFLLPGIYVYLRLSLAPAAMMIGRVGPLDAIRMSWNLTAQALSATFVVVLFQLACTFGVAFVSIRMAGGAFAASENVMIVESLVTALFLPLPTLAFAELALRLSGIYGDAQTGLATSRVSDTPAHRVHVPGAPAPAGPMPAGLQQPQPQPRPQPTAGPYAAQAGWPQQQSAPGMPIPQPQPQALWSQSPQPQAQTHEAVYGAPPTHATQPAPYGQHHAAPAQPQPYAPHHAAPAQPQPYAPHHPAPAQPQELRTSFQLPSLPTQPHAGAGPQQGQPAPPTAPPPGLAPRPDAVPAPPSRSHSIAPPGLD